MLPPILSTMRATLGLILVALTLLPATALTGNADAIDPSAIQDTAALPTPPLDANVIGQTFRMHYPRLSAVQVRFSVPAEYLAPRAARVTLHVRAFPAADRDLATASIPLDQIRNDEFIKFTFTPISDSENQNLYFFFGIESTTVLDDRPPPPWLTLWSSADEAYPNGTLYINHIPTARDLVFRAYYSPDLGILARALLDTLVQYPIAVLIFMLLILASANRVRPYGSLAFLVLLAFVTALVQIRDLPAPLWVDSLTHAQYVKFILTNARLPTENFYHLGFHVLAALISKFLDLSIARSLLLTGQFSWVLVGVASFFFSRKLCSSQIAGLASAASVWFLSPTPAYFITWGRYPLVLGSALLPFSLVGAVNLIERKSGRSMMIASIAFAWLAFTQIRLTAFYVAFVAIYGVVAARRSRLTPRESSTKLQTLISNRMTLLISFLFIPVLWFLYLFAHGLTAQAILLQNQTAPTIDLQTALDVVLTHHGAEFYLLAMISAILGLVRRSRVTFLMLGWLAALVTVALIPPLVGELVPLSLVVLMAFLPASILVGDAARLAFKRLRAPSRIVHAAAWVALIGGVGILGARDMINIANPATILFTRADERAMDWIDANVPPDAKFLVNSFDWVGTTFVPSDGGGWIPYFVGRQIEYLDSSAPHIDSESVLTQWIKAHRIQYVYLGPRAGVLHWANFVEHPDRFGAVYDRDGVRIFRVQ